MLNLLQSLAYAISALFFLVDPVGGIPVFIAITESHTDQEKKKALNTAIIVATITLVIFGLGSNYIFTFFGFTLPAFRIAGGIILFIIAIEMIFGTRRHKPSDNSVSDMAEKQAIGFVPLGIPLLAGPGAITAAILLFSSESTIQGMIIGIIAILVVMALSYVLFNYSTWIIEHIGRVGALAVSRIMGLLLTAIAVQMIIDGSTDVLKGIIG